MEIRKSTSQNRTQMVWNVVKASSTILATIANQNKQRIAKALSHRDGNVIFAYEINSIFACSESKWAFKLLRRLCLNSIGGSGWLCTRASQFMYFDDKRIYPEWEKAEVMQNGLE